MNKNEVIELIKLIDVYFPGRVKTEDPKRLIEAWTIALEGQDFEKVKQNLIEYVRTSHFPPTIADLIAANKPVVVSASDTMDLLAKMQQWEKEARK